MKTIQDKLEYVRAKLGLVPAFGDSIGQQVTKSELGVCHRLVGEVLAELAAKPATEGWLTLEQWLDANGRPYCETRYAGQPHECLAVQMDGHDAARHGLFALADYQVVGVVSGNFVELEKRATARN